MADYYTMYSEQIINLTPEEQDFWDKVMRIDVDSFNQSGD
jgi:hypothetical protein